MAEGKLRVRKMLMIPFVCLILCVAAALAVSVFLSELKTDFCKQIINYDGGYAVLQQNDKLVYIAKTDKEGELLSVVPLFSYEAIMGSVFDYNTMFEGSDGELYVICRSVSDSGNNIKYNLYEVDFNLSEARYVMHFKLPDEYMLTDRDIPYYDGDKLYLDLINYVDDQLEGVDTYAFSSDGSCEKTAGTKIESNSVWSDQAAYTPEGPAALMLKDGVIYNGKTIYPETPSDDTLVNGLTYTDGKLSFYDLSNKLIVKYDTSSGNITTTEADLSFYEECEDIFVRPDDTVTASIRRDGMCYPLVYEKDKATTFTELSGSVSMKCFTVYFVKFAVIVAVLMFVTGFLFLRRKKVSKETKRVRFIGVASRVMILTILISGIYIVISADVFISDCEKDAEVNKKKNAGVVCGYLVSCFENENFLDISEADDGTVVLTDDSYKRVDDFLYRFTENEETANSSGKYDASLYVIKGYTTDDNSVYCIYNDTYMGTVPADYFISKYAESRIKKTSKSLKSELFYDITAKGKKAYSVFPVEISDKEGRKYTLAITLSTDHYRDLSESLEHSYRSVKTLLVCTFLILLIVYIVIKLSFRSINKLSRAVINYNTTKQLRGLDSIKGQNEAATTARAIEQMVKGLEIYTNDLIIGNRNYRRLLPSGVLELMGKESILDVKPGDHVRYRMLIVSMTFEGAYTNDLLEKLRDICIGNKGYIVSFESGRLNSVFPSKTDPAKLAQEFIAFENSIGTGSRSHHLKMFMTTGDVEAGSIGNNIHAYLTAASVRAGLIDDMKRFYAAAESGCVFTGELGAVMRSIPDYRTRLINIDRSEKIYELVKIDRTAQRPELKTRRAFENAVRLLSEGRREKAGALLERITCENSSDVIAAGLLETCRKR